MSKDRPKYRRYPPQERRRMLIDAGLECLAEDGIAGFSVEKVSAAAGSASRGLIGHHFGSRQGLLKACYTAAYDRMLGAAAPGRSESADLNSLIESLLADDQTSRGVLRAWLALWGEVSNDPDMMAEHRRYYDHFLAHVIAAIEAEARGRSLKVPPRDIAVLFISTVDGLWLERCLDPDRLSRTDVRRACTDLLEAFLGPLVAS